MSLGQNLNPQQLSQAGMTSNILNHMDGDFCLDTPNQHKASQNSPYMHPVWPRDSEPGSRPYQFMNFMDYSNDECMFLFTPQQKDRMRRVIAAYRRHWVRRSGYGAQRQDMARYGMGMEGAARQAEGATGCKPPSQAVQGAKRQTESSSQSSSQCTVQRGDSQSSGQCSGPEDTERTQARRQATSPSHASQPRKIVGQDAPSRTTSNLVSRQDTHGHAQYYRRLANPPVSMGTLVRVILERVLGHTL